MQLRDPIFKVNQEKTAHFILEEIRREAQKPMPFPYAPGAHATSGSTQFGQNERDQVHAELMQFKAAGDALINECQLNGINTAGISDSMDMDLPFHLGKMASMAQITDQQTLEDTGLQLASERILDSPMKAKEIYNISLTGGVPQILLNIPSEAFLVPVEGILSPIDIGHRNLAVNQEKFKLRSPSKATQEEIDLTKRYIGVNEEIKQ